MPKPHPISITTAVWWGNKLRDTSWLKAEDERYKSLCEQHRQKAKLTEKRIHSFEVHLAHEIDELLKGQENNPGIMVGGGMGPEYSFDPIIAESAGKAGFQATAYMFPPRCYTNIRRTVIAGSHHERDQTLSLIHSWPR